MIDKLVNSDNELVWVDLFNPLPEEINQVEAEFGINIPSRLELEEIETSSRIQIIDHNILMGIPNIFILDSDEPPSPLGFILNPNLLITIRYLPLNSFNLAKKEFKRIKEPIRSADVFSLIAGQLVETGADQLEKISSKINFLSKSIFKRYLSPREHALAHTTHRLRNILLSLGQLEQKLSQIREVQLGLQRIIPFAQEKGQKFMGQETQNTLQTLILDLDSLIDFDSHLGSKIQFLLDAILGFINTEQNDIFKVLTVVSVIGIPPTFIASWYGMNFQFIPELAWIHGYPYVIILTAISIILPLIWFKWRGWL